MEEIPFDERFQCDPIENGLELILRGLEFLTDNPTPRRRKHAILNLAAGVEALLRERLRQEHWSLVFADPSKAAKADYEEGSFEAVSLVECLERLARTCGLDVPARWRWGITSLARRRNQLEARGLVDATPVVQAIACAVVGPFVDSVPPGRLTDSLHALLEGVRNRLVTLQGRIDEAQMRIVQKHPTERLVACPNCRLEKSIVVEDGGPLCLFCGFTGKPEDVAEAWVADAHDLMAADEERYVYRCPTCGREAFIDAGHQQEDPWYKCLACGKVWEMDDVAFCAWCGQPFEPPDDDPEEEYCEACRGEGEGDDDRK